MSRHCYTETFTCVVNVPTAMTCICPALAFTCLLCCSTPCCISPAPSHLPTVPSAHCHACLLTALLACCFLPQVMPTSKLQEHTGSDKAWVWSAVDYADGEHKVELFCIRFGSPESE